jgi:hypothetical protein
LAGGRAIAYVNLYGYFLLADLTANLSCAATAPSVHVTSCISRQYLLYQQTIPAVSAESTTCISRQYHLYQLTVPLVSADSITCISRRYHLYQQTVPIVSADTHNGENSKIICVCLTTNHYFTTMVQFVGNNTTSLFVISRFNY